MQRSGKGLGAYQFSPWIESVSLSVQSKIDLRLFLLSDLRDHPLLNIPSHLITSLSKLACIECAELKGRRNDENSSG